MMIPVSRYGRVAVLSPKSELTGDSADSFVASSRQLADSGDHNVVVDCSEVDGLDSAALEALLELQNRCEELRGHVKLCCLDATCQKILELTRLARRFEMFDDLESAVKSFI